jgi:uncharacterized membrane protein
MWSERLLLINGLGRVLRNSPRIYRLCFERWHADFTDLSGFAQIFILSFVVARYEAISVAISTIVYSCAVASFLAMTCLVYKTLTKIIHAKTRQVFKTCRVYLWSIYFVDSASAVASFLAMTCFVVTLF